MGVGLGRRAGGWSATTKRSVFLSFGMRCAPVRIWAGAEHERQRSGNRASNDVLLIAVFLRL